MNKTGKLTFLALVLVLVTVATNPQNASAQNERKENWLGTLDVKVAKLRLQLDITIDADGKCVGEMISLDQGSARLEMDSIVRTNEKLEFEIKKAQIHFSGSMNDDETMATGKFTQVQAYDMQFKRVAEVKPDKHIQTWKGTLKAAGKTFDFQFRVFEDGEGTHFAKLDSFSESLFGIPCEIEHNEEGILVTIPSTRAKYSGTLSDDGQIIEGNWLQSGGKFPLELERIPLDATRSTELKRPQTPQPPFDYDVEDFLVKVHDVDPKYEADVELAGTLTSPHGDGPFPTLILISGSGPQDRDETIYEHKPFLVIADYFAQKGYAVIRFDDRGVAKSKGSFATATSADFANDVEALFLWAKTCPKVDSKKIVLVGHSEGGLIAPMVASRQKEIAGVIMLAGPGVSGDRIILNQSRKISKVAGMPDAILDMQENMLTMLLKHLNSGAEVDDDLKESIQAAFSELTDQQREKFQLDGVAEATIAKLNSPWMRFFINYDPKESLSKTACPILSIIGENDLQVEKELNFPAIEAAVKSGDNQDFVQITLPKLNHLFQRSDTGAPGNYIKIEQTLDASLLNAMSEWLETRTGK